MKARLRDETLTLQMSSQEVLDLIVELKKLDSNLEPNLDRFLFYLDSHANYLKMVGGKK